MTFGLIGGRLGHSFSRIIHEYLTGVPYELRELRPDELEPFLKREPFKGVNVTIPYKQAVISFLDELAPSAQITGAVNVIIRAADGRLTGHNTDYDGFLEMAGRAGVELEGASVVILGAGGAAKAAQAAVRSAGAARVANAVRHDFGPARLPISDPSAFADCDILVNATPVGMYPDIQGKPVDIGALPRLRGVLDCIYNPLRTRLVLDAVERGIPCEGGLMMVVAQAVRAAELFHGRSFGSDAIDRVYRHMTATLRNIVLTGMPSCGKTTFGKALAARTGMEFVDTDALIAEKAGMSIPAIFASEGEAGFRIRESSVIESLALRQGLVIATGGGSVLSGANVSALRQNGVTVFLDCPVSLLDPSPDRPLSASRDALQKLYDERYPVYLRTADYVIPAAGTAEQVVDSIEKRIF